MVRTSALYVQDSLFIRVYPSFQSRSRVPLTGNANNMSYVFRRVHRDSANDVGSGFQITKDSAYILLAPKVRAHRRPRAKEDTNNKDYMDVHRLRTLSNRAISVKYTRFNYSMTTWVASAGVINRCMGGIELLIILSIALLDNVVAS